MGAEGVLLAPEAARLIRHLQAGGVELVAGAQWTDVTGDENVRL